MPSDVALIPNATSTLRKRIYAKIDRQRRRRRECWHWLGKFVQKRGSVRPVIQVGGRGSRTITIARLLLVLRDRVPLAERDAAELEAGHLCGNPHCVNVRHLRWQTRSENEIMKHELALYRQWSDLVDRLADVEDSRAAA